MGSLAMSPGIVRKPVGNTVRRRRILLMAVVVALLEAACRVGLIDPNTMVPPSRMVVALAALLREEAIYNDMAQTFFAVGVSVLVATVAGFLLGILIHSFPRLRRAVAPILTSYYAIPVFAFYPGLAAVMGLGPGPIIITAIFNAVVSMIIATMDALDRFPRVLLKLAHMHHFSWWQRVIHLQLPAIASNLLPGIKLVVAYSFIGVIGSEFLMAAAGVGYEISYAYDNFNVPRMYGLMLLVIVVVVVINSLLSVPERWFAARALGRRAE